MKKIIFGIIAIIMFLVIINIKNIKTYNYYKSHHFFNDMLSLESCISGYQLNNMKMPSSFSSFLPAGEKLLADDHPMKPTNNFYKLRIEFLEKDSLFIIYLHGFDKENDLLSTNKHVNSLKWYDIFLFRGDIIVDSLSNAPLILGGDGPPPKKKENMTPE